MNKHVSPYNLEIISEIAGDFVKLINANDLGMMVHRCRMSRVLFIRSSFIIKNNSFSL